MIDKIFDLGDTTVREVMVPLVDVAALPDTATPDDAVALIQRARLLAHPDLHRPRVQRGRRGHRHGPPAAAAPSVRTLRRAHAPGHLRAGDQAHRRPPARDAEGPHPARGGGGRVRRRRRHRHASRTSSSRSSARSRTSTTARRPPSSGCPTAATGWRGRTDIDELNEALDWEPAQGRLRDGGRPRPGHPAPHPPVGEVLQRRPVHLHRARGRRPPGRGGEDRAPRPRRPPAPPSVNRSRRSGGDDDGRQDGGVSEPTAARPRAIWRLPPPARARACS